MECNKEEAIRAMELSERKNEDNDFTGALMLAQKACRLFPNLENITRLLAKCEVFYLMFEVGHAESSGGHRLQGSLTLSTRQNLSFTHENEQPGTFRTCCPVCMIELEYYKIYENQKLFCRTCQSTFIARDLSIQGVHPRSSMQDNSKGASGGIENPPSSPFGNGNVPALSPMSKDCEFIHLDETGGSLVVELNGGHLLRRSSRKRENFPYMDDNNFVSPSKKFEKEPKQKACERGFPSKRRKIGDELESKAALPETAAVPGSGFNKSVLDVGLLKKKLSANQTWALYDPVDGIPRVYGRIVKVFSRRFKLKMRWLEADPDDEGGIAWCNNALPVACGKYRLGNYEEVTDPLMISHQVHCIKGNGRRSSFLVYPMKGETWAFYQNWDMGWSFEPEKHIPKKFEYVEVLTDFVESKGIGVAYLSRVEGFASLFQRSKEHGDGVVLFQVPPNELNRFSHRIPSFNMTGDEKYGVPKGSFEFDPACLPTGADDFNVPLKSKELVFPRKMNNKKRRKSMSIYEFSESRKNEKRAAADSELNGGHQPKISSSRKKHNLSCN